MRTFYVQVIAAPALKERAESSWTRTIQLDAPRGLIYDRDGARLAVSETRATISADPQRVKDPVAAAEALAPILDIPAAELTTKLAREGAFVYLARKVPSSKGEEVRRLGLAGVFVDREDKRMYPTSPLAPQLLGFVGTDNKGLSRDREAV